MKLCALVVGILTTDDEVVITKNGRAAAVLISPDEFGSLRETVKIKGDRELMAEIKKGLADLKKKKAKIYTLSELFDISQIRTKPCTSSK